VVDATIVSFSFLKVDVSSSSYCLCDDLSDEISSEWFDFKVEVSLLNLWFISVILLS